MPFWRERDPLVLASRSSARRALLEAAGIPLELHPADFDERALERGASLAPGAVAQFLSREKAAAVSRARPGRLVLAADQVASLGAQRFSKPADRAMARAQLSMLSGRSHELHSAITFAQDETVLFEHVEVARLTMRPLSEAFLDAYLDAAGSAVTASVGAYQVEGLGIQLFERIEGDYFTVLGLPLISALDFLRRRGCLLA
jgi:nucleoside triphosphate pyrophosphatase